MTKILWPTIKQRNRLRLLRILRGLLQSVIWRSCRSTVTIAELVVLRRSAIWLKIPSICHCAGCRIFSSKYSSAHMAVRNAILITNRLCNGNSCTFITITSVEGEMIIGLNYITPSIKNCNFALDEWQHIITNRRRFICGGGFNAGSSMKLSTLGKSTGRYQGRKNSTDSRFSTNSSLLPTLNL